ncbi:hypothetical protein [Sphingomonas sp. UYP23]
MQRLISTGLILEPGEMTNPNPDALDWTDPLWQVLLDHWVSETMPVALHRIVVALQEWRELPLWEHLTPDKNVYLRSRFDAGCHPNIGVHLRDNMCGVSGWTIVRGGKWSFDMSQEPSPLISLADRKSICCRIALWLDQIANGLRQTKQVVDQHRRRLCVLGGGAVNISLPDRIGQIHEHGLGRSLPRLSDKNARHTNARSNEYCCSEPLVIAFVADSSGPVQVGRIFAPIRTFASA